MLPMKATSSTKAKLSIAGNARPVKTAKAGAREQQAAQLETRRDHADRKRQQRRSQQRSGRDHADLRPVLNPIAER